MRTTFLLTLTSIVTLIASHSTYADTEIIPSPDPTCNQYFDAGYVYEGDYGKVLSDTLRNTGVNELDLYADEQVSPFVGVSTPGVVSFTTPEFQYADPFFTNCAGTWCIGGASGRQFTYLTAGQAFKWIQTLPNKHLQVVSVDKSKVTDANRAQIRDSFFNIRYTIKGHFWSDASNSFVADFNHVECQKIGVHFCGDGVVESGVENCDPADPTKAGWANGGCNTSCQPVVVATPSCDSITASPTFGTSPVTTTLTCSGSNLPVGSTYAISCGNGINATMSGSTGTCTYANTQSSGSLTFTPKCTINGTITAPACQTNVGINPIPVPPGVPTPNLIIKKYVKGIDAQTVSGEVQVVSGEVYPYTFSVRNTSTTSASGARVIDTFPADIELIGTATGTNWTCTSSGQTMDCLYNSIITIATVVPTITVQARIRPTAPIGVPIRNVVAVCARDPRLPANDPANNCIPDPAPCRPGDINYDPMTQLCDPATVIIRGPYVSIKKYAKEISASGDTQTAPIAVARGEYFNYYYQLQNTGSVAATYVVVKDTLPTYLTFTGPIVIKNSSGTNVSSDWLCTQGSQIFPGETVSRIALICNKLTPLPANSGLYTFTVPVVLASGAPVAVNMQNVVYVCADNVAANPTGPNGEVICGNNNPPPPPPPNQCTPTNNPNKDPACIVVPPPVCTVNCGGGGSSTTYYIQSCVNSLNSCAAQSHGSLAICQAANPGKVCHTDINLCNTATALVCSGPGGPTPGGGGNPYGRCGDGVLGSSPGEECDVIGAPWCVSCKIQLDTTPGANPITSMWIRIPALGGTSKGIGSSFIKKRLDADGTNADAYRIVVGKDTNVFTLADQVIFGVTTEFQIPIIVPANKKMCLQASGASVNSPKGICTTFGDSSIATTPINGTDYVVLGAGSYQQRLPNGTYQRVDIQNPVHETSLFRGSTQYSQLGETNVGPTLRDAFKGVGSPADQGSINLFGCSGIDCSPSAVTQMITIPVRISNMLVSSIGSSSNRSLELVLNPANPFVGFLGTTSMNTSTTASNNTTNNVAVTLPTIVGTVANPTISSVTELERYAVNGNRNILAVTGDLTITCPAGSTVFTMNGIRTVIVTGNLIIRCNIVYGSSDSSSSWAWIAKNGNIQVSNGTGIPNVGAVTNLAGVYVAVKDVGSTTGGDITYVGNTTTQAILRIEGTLYGNASPLFASRLYARATGAYDILTTGTILTYSNRALMSPPPLLSQYLGTYQVQRVVQ